MTLNNFLSYLQQLLSMVNPLDDNSVALAKNALSATVSLAKESSKADFDTIRVMEKAVTHFVELAKNAKDYAGRPGDYHGNEKRRRRLMMSLAARC